MDGAFFFKLYNILTDILHDTPHSHAMLCNATYNVTIPTHLPGEIIFFFQLLHKISNTNITYTTNTSYDTTNYYLQYLSISMVLAVLITYNTVNYNTLLTLFISYISC